MSLNKQFSNKELLQRLNTLLDGFQMSKSPELMPAIDMISGKQHSELRNYRKKMTKMFKNFSYERKLQELAELEQRLQEKTQNDSNKDGDSGSNEQGGDRNHAVSGEESSG